MKLKIHVAETFRGQYLSQMQTSILLLLLPALCLAYTWEQALGVLGQVQNSTRDLLKGVLMLTESLDPLPETACLALHLAFYDENTPADYVPRGFQSAEKELILPASSTKVKVGKVSKGHHIISVRTQHARKAGSVQSTGAVPQ